MFNLKSNPCYREITNTDGCVYIIQIYYTIYILTPGYRAAVITQNIPCLVVKNMVWRAASIS